ncbi:MAG: DUF4185 domain-containing protein [Desulfosarcina sp.]
MNQRSQAEPAGRRRRLMLSGILWAALFFAGCQWPADPPHASIHLHAGSWSAADGLFHQDSRWLGADDAHSVDLNDGRILWLFGDTFIAPDGSPQRARADLIRNSIGIQTGSDPSTAAMAFFWRRMAVQRPASFFAESGFRWFWPGDGMRIGNRLLIFLTMIEPAENDLGFAVAGWRSVRVENPDAVPGRWCIEAARQAPHRFVVALGAGGVLLHGGYLYAYGTPPSGNAAYLARWPEQKAGVGDLRDPQWWCGNDLGWQNESSLKGLPAALFIDGQAEFGVHYEPRVDRYIQIQTIGFGAVDLGFRTAARPEGPWSPLNRFYSPQEASASGILIYAAKSHPFLTGADLVVTYATNYLDSRRLMASSELYYPRFLKVAVSEVVK